MNYIGIDHHKQYSHLTLMDAEGRGASIWPGDQSSVRDRKISSRCGKAEAVIESGLSSYAMVDVLEEMAV